MPESSRLRPVFRACLVLVVVTAIETLSCASLHLMEWRAPGSVVEVFLANHFANRVTTAEIRQRHPKMTVVDVAEQEFSRSEFNVGPFKGHPSPYGNRVIASALARDLRAFFADR